MKPRAKLSEWVKSAYNNENAPFCDIHFGEIDDFDLLKNGESNLLYIALKIYRTVYKISKDQFPRSKKRIVVYIPLGESDKIVMWSQKLLDVKVDVEECSLYVAGMQGLFEESDEEYRRIIYDTGLDDGTMDIFFRCFRNKQAAIKNWEFNTGLYLVSKK